MGTKEELAFCIQKINEVEDYHLILEDIFYIVKNHPKDYKYYRSLINQISHVFTIDGEELVNYINGKVYYSIEDFELNTGKYKKTLDVINKIKRRYTSIIFDWTNANKTPFMMTGIETAISYTVDRQLLKIIRADFEELTVEANPDVIVNAINVLSSTVLSCIEDGIYSFDDDTIERYVGLSKELTKLLLEAGNKNDDVN